MGWDLHVGFEQDFNWWFRFEKEGKSGQVCRIHEYEMTTRDLWPLMAEEEGGGSFQYVHGLLKVRLAEIGQAPKIADSFPYLALAANAIKSLGHPGQNIPKEFPESGISEYGGKGLAWISEFGEREIDWDLAYFLFKCLSNRELPQELRNRLQLCVRRWESANGLCFLRGNGGRCE